MRSGYALLALLLALAACDLPEDGAAEPDATAEDGAATVGPAESEAVTEGAATPGVRGPRPPWLGEEGTLEIEGVRYEAEPVLMIVDRDRLEQIGSRDGIELYRPDWANDPPARIFVEEEPDRWRPFARVRPLPG